MSDKLVDKRGNANGELEALLSDASILDYKRARLKRAWDESPREIKGKVFRNLGFSQQRVHNILTTTKTEENLDRINRALTEALAEHIERTHKLIDKLYYL